MNWHMPPHLRSAEFKDLIYLEVKSEKEPQIVFFLGL